MFETAEGRVAGRDRRVLESRRPVVAGVTARWIPWGEHVDRAGVEVGGEEEKSFDVHAEGHAFIDGTAG